jgi:hypothetical protein
MLLVFIEEVSVHHIAQLAGKSFRDYLREVETPVPRVISGGFLVLDSQGPRAL